jgi:hypothetical protein
VILIKNIFWCLLVAACLVAVPARAQQSAGGPLAPHPRIFLTAERVAELGNLVQTRNPWWARIITWSSHANRKKALSWDGPNLALIYAVLATGKVDPVLGREKGEMAKECVFRVIGKPAPNDALKASDLISRVALTFDWAHSAFSPAQRSQVAAWLVTQAKRFADAPDNCFSTQNAAIMRMLTLAGLAAAGDAEGGSELADLALEKKFKGSLLTCLKNAGQGGGWFEGDTAGARAGLYIMQTAEAFKTSRGIDLSDQVQWFNDRLFYLMFNLMPRASKTKLGFQFPTSQDGDESISGVMAADLVRLQLLFLRKMLPNTEAAGWVQSMLMHSRRPVILTPELYGQEFIMLDSQAPQKPLATAPLAWHAKDMGRVYTRTDWSERGTWLKLSAGPHFAKTQHLDAGAIELFKEQPLLISGGSFDSPVSEHALNYAKRSLAHTTLRIIDPSEYSWFDLGAGKKPKGAYANDGGQRAFASFGSDGSVKKSLPWAPQNWQEFQQAKDIYRLGQITKFETRKRYFYAAADLTAAYRGSTQKVGRVVRHLVHFLPGGPQDSKAAEVIALVDDVELNRPAAEVRFVAHLPGKPDPMDGLKRLGWGRYRGPIRQLSFSGRLGRLKLIAVYPEKMQLYMLGVPGKADGWVNGKNYPSQQTSLRSDPWRVEFSPQDAKGKIRPMVTAILPSELDAPPPPKVTALPTPQQDVVGLLIHDDLWPRVLALKLGAPFKQGKMSYDLPPGRGRHLVAGLAPQTDFTVKLEAGKVIISPGQGLKSSAAGLLAFVVEPKKKDDKAK